VSAAPPGTDPAPTHGVPTSDDPADAEGSATARGISPIATAAIALIAALVGFTIGATLPGEDGALSGEPAAESAAVAAPASPVSAEDLRPVLGDDAAPVTIELFSDFGCPFCARFDRETEPELIARYVDTGQVRIAWYDVPFQGPTSVQLHVAARAAERQGRFWEFKDAAFRTDGRDASPEVLRALASEAGLDAERFEQDLADPTLEELVLADLRAAQAAGVTGTPAFLIDGRPLMGAQPLPAFVELIETALAERGERTS
jgi:protein-disulfide isomerase